MATYNVKVEQLSRVTLNVNVEAEDEESALALAENTDNWGDYEQEDEDVIENRPVEATPTEATGI